MNEIDYFVRELKKDLKQWDVSQYVEYVDIQHRRGKRRIEINGTEMPGRRNVDEFRETAGIIDQTFLSRPNTTGLVRGQNWWGADIDGFSAVSWEEPGINYSSNNSIRHEILRVVECAIHEALETAVMNVFGFPPECCPNTDKEEGAEEAYWDKVRARSLCWPHDPERERWGFHECIGLKVPPKIKLKVTFVRHAYTPMVVF